MRTLFLACCQCSNAHSMWCDVVNSIPCLVGWLLGVILLIFIAKYGAEWIKAFNEIKKDNLNKKLEEHSIRIDAIEKELKNQLSENKLNEDFRVLQRISKEEKELWKEYKKKMEELYASQQRATTSTTNND